MARRRATQSLIMELNHTLYMKHLVGNLWSEAMLLDKILSLSKERTKLKFQEEKEEEPESPGYLKEMTGFDHPPPSTPQFARHVQRLVDDPVYAKMYEEYVQIRS